MSSVPGECQTLADQVASLEQQYTSLATTVTNSVGQEAWSSLARLGALRLQLSTARDALTACVKAHSAALTGNAVVMDASGGSPNGPQLATLWDLTGSAPVQAESSPLQAGAFGFQGPLPNRAAITIATTGVAEITGFDFRSGPLDSLPSSTRVEMVIAPVLTLTQSRLNRWASAFQPTTIPLQQSVTATVGAAAASLRQDSITVGVNGLLSGQFANVDLPQTSYSANVSLTVFPSTAPDTGEIVRVALVGTNPIQVELSGSLLGPLVSSLTSLASPLLGELVRSAISDWVHQAVPAFTAEMLSLPQLPPVSITLRNITIASDGITFQPLLGAIGTALSTFHPSALPPP